MLFSSWHGPSGSSSSLEARPKKRGSSALNTLASYYFKISFAKPCSFDLQPSIKTLKPKLEQPNATVEPSLHPSLHKEVVPLVSETSLYQHERASRELFPYWQFIDL